VGAFARKADSAADCAAARRRPCADRAAPPAAQLSGFEEAATLGDSRSLFQGRDGGPGSAAGGSPRSTSPFVHAAALYPSDGGDAGGVGAPPVPQRFSELSHSHSSSSLLRATLQRSMSTSSQMASAGAPGGGGGGGGSGEDAHAGTLSPRSSSRLLPASPRHGGGASPRAGSVLSFDALRSASAGDLTLPQQLQEAVHMSRSASALSAQLAASGGGSDGHGGGGSVGDLSAALQSFVLAGGGGEGGAEDTVGPLPRVSSRQAFASAAAQVAVHSQAAAAQAQAQLAAAAEEEAALAAQYSANFGVPPPQHDQYGSAYASAYGALPYGGAPPMAQRMGSGQGVPPPMYMPHPSMAQGGYPPNGRGMGAMPPPPMLYEQQLALLQMQAQMAQLAAAGDPSGALAHMQRPGGMPPHGYASQGMPGAAAPMRMPFMPGGAAGVPYYSAPPPGMYPPGVGGPYGLDGGVDPAFYAAYYARIMEMQALTAAHGSAAAAAIAAASMGAYGAGPAFGGAFPGGPRDLHGSAAAMAMAAGAAAVLGGPYYGMPYHHAPGMGGFPGGPGGPGGSGGGGLGDGRSRERDRAPRSSVLEDFKSNKAFKYELPDLVGHVAEFAQDQHGSRFIQLKLETASPEAAGALFSEMMVSVNKLMTDVFGNYVVQFFIAHGSPEQRTELVKQLHGRVLPLSLQMYGCRVIQKALEVLDVEGQRSLVDELEGHVLTCVHDQNGNHVVQKAIEYCPPELRQRFMAAFAGASLRLAQHPYGCRVVQVRCCGAMATHHARAHMRTHTLTRALRVHFFGFAQRILEHCTREEQAAMGLMTEILGAAGQLSACQYGNYVVQARTQPGC
jgi:hypothetical protein